MLTCERYHDFSAGHRVAGHESKCAMLHGHNYRVHFECEGDTAMVDSIGRVIDFSAIKANLCQWIEDNWDHRFLVWEEDVLMRNVFNLLVDSGESDISTDDYNTVDNSLVFVPFNPTAENMADHLLRVIAPKQLEGTGVSVIRVRVEETRKCSATAKL